MGVPVFLEEKCAVLVTREHLGHGVHRGGRLWEPCRGPLEEAPAPSAPVMDDAAWKAHEAAELKAKQAAEAKLKAAEKKKVEKGQQRK